MHKRVIIWTGALLAIVAAAVGGWWVYANPRSDLVASQGGMVALDPQSQDSDKNSTALPNEGADPGTAMPNSTASPKSSSGAVAGQSLTVKDGSKNDSTSGGTPKPENFADYEQYKDSKSALFGEIVVGKGTAEVGQSSGVVLNYRGWLTNGKEFDESYSRGKPFAFMMGQNSVIPGFEQGLMGMKVGGKRRVIIPPVAGYGASASEKIPANSVLVFELELLEIR